jgi:FkbM family methyltransferase
MRVQSTNIVPRRFLLAHYLIQLWPFLRGRGLLVKPFLYKLDRWPENAWASFRFRFGRFVDAPIAAWPRGYRDLFLYGVIEPYEVAMWYRVLKSGANVVDGGANWGYWSLVASTLVGKSGQVYAFEPVPDTSKSLRENLRASQANNVIVHQAALAEKDGTIHINLVTDDPIGGQSSIGMPGDRRAKEMIECKQVALDEVIQEKPVHLIKLDIEGGELAALKGSINILQRTEKPIITFEWNRVTATALGYQPEAIQEYLSRYDYRFFLATKSGLIPFKERTNYVQWSPMVWALTKAHQGEFGI